MGTKVCVCGKTISDKEYACKTCSKILSEYRCKCCGMPVIDPFDKSSVILQYIGNQDNKKFLCWECRRMGNRALEQMKNNPFKW